MRLRVYFITNPKGMSSLESLSKDDIPLGLVIDCIRTQLRHKIIFGQK